MTSSPQFAERRLDLLKPSGERIAFRFGLGPTRSDGLNFYCGVQLHGWGDSPPDVWGNNSLQAIMNAAGLVHSLLTEFVKRGGRVVWPDTDIDYPLDEFMFSP